MVFVSYNIGYILISRTRCANIPELTSLKFPVACIERYTGRHTYNYDPLLNINFLAGAVFDSILGGFLFFVCKFYLSWLGGITPVFMAVPA